jgi:CHAT domain-containing protein
MKHLLTLLLFALLSLTASAQSADAFQPFEAAFQQKQKLSPRLMQAYRDTLISLREAGQQDQALTHFKANLLPRMEELPSTVAVELWYWAARSAMDIIRYNDAIAYAKPAIQLSDASPEALEQHQRYDLKQMLAVAYVNIWEMDMAILAFEAILAFTDTDETDKANRRGRAYSAMAYAYGMKDQYEESEAYFKKAEEQCRKAPPESTCFINYYDFRESCYTRQQQYEKALAINKKALAIAERPNAPKAIRDKRYQLYYNIGRLYYYKNELESAIHYYKKARREQDTPKRSANIHTNIGSCYSSLGNHAAAAHHFDEAFRIVGFSLNRPHPFDGLPTTDFYLQIMLYFKGESEQDAYLSGEGLDHLYRARIYRKLCIMLLEKMGSELEEPGSARLLLDQFYYIYEEAINVSYMLYELTDSLHHLEAAYEYAARSKVMRVRELAQKAAKEEGLPAPLLARQLSLREAYTRLENRRFEQAGAIAELRDSALLAKQAYYRYMDSLRAVFPRYTQLWEAPPPPKLHELQAELRANGQGLLQYFIAYQYVFTFVITGEEVKLLKAPLPADLSDRVAGLREAIYQWVLTDKPELKARYTEDAHWLYEQLFAPVADLLPERVVIIPDHSLAYLPFDVLLSERPGTDALFSDYPYLLKRYQFSYAHSPYLLFAHHQERRRARRAQVLALAPSFDELSTVPSSIAARQREFGPLTANRQEVERLATLLPAELLVGEAATRQSFLAAAPEYQLLHLATHAKANNEKGGFSFLSFSEQPGDSTGSGRLYARELYSMSLPAELVVLSACETGIGQLSRGEGVMGLSHAFAKAGAKSLVTTLWRVSDQASAQLMGYFYEALSQGAPKDEALRQAKLRYLESVPPQQQHPFFWAAYIPQGDMSPVRLRAKRPWGYWGLAVVMFGLGLWWWRG